MVTQAGIAEAVKRKDTVEALRVNRAMRRRLAAKKRGKGGWGWRRKKERDGI